jgi:hypothetical protein
MKKTITVAALGLILIAVSYWNLHNRSHVHQAKETALVTPDSAQMIAGPSSRPSTESAPNPSSAPTVAPGKNSDTKDSTPLLPPTQPRNELESLNELAKVLFEATRPNQPMNSLVSYLKATAQDPYLVKNANPYTGELTFVRTNSPFPGTRYFHAQYFSDKNNQPFAQHLSFEYKPGPDSMKQATAAIQQAFPHLGAAKTREKGNFTEWDAGGGYTVWLRRLTSEDIRRSNDPYAVHTPDDVGTIAVAIQQNPEHGEHR